MSLLQQCRDLERANQQLQQLQTSLADARDLSAPGTSAAHRIDALRRKADQLAAELAWVQVDARQALELQRCTERNATAEPADVLRWRPPPQSAPSASPAANSTSELARTA